MDITRWSNVTHARKSYDLGHTHADGFPLEAFFEISARCNLRCQMCAINYDQRYKPRAGRPPLFEPDLFERLRPLFPTLVRAYLFGLGEPLFSQVGSPELDEHYARENLGVGVPDRVVAAFAEAVDRSKALNVRLASRFLGERQQFDYVRTARKMSQRWSCSEPWASIWVTSAGEVRTCCINDTSFGNLLEQTIEQIWNGEAFR